MVFSIILLNLHSKTRNDMSTKGTLLVVIFILCIGALFFLPTKSTEEEPLTDNPIDTLIVSDTVIIHIEAPKSIKVHKTNIYIGDVYKFYLNIDPFNSNIVYIRILDIKDNYIQHTWADDLEEAMAGNQFTTSSSQYEMSSRFRFNKYEKL